MAAEALSETLAAPVRPNISLYDETSTEKREAGDREDRGGVWGNLGIFTGEDERFAYVRLFQVQGRKLMCRNGQYRD